MDKTAIKNFAIWARNKLKSDIKVRAGFMGITESGIASPLPASTSDIQYFDVASSEPVKLQGREIEMRRRIVSKLEQHAKESGYQIAYDSLIENTASEWFNRLIAIRYMEVNDYFSDGLRMLSSVQEGKQDPDIVSRPFGSDLEFTEKESAQINDWMDHNKADNLFRFLLLKRCNQLAEALPGLFEEAGDASEFFLRLGFVEKDGFVYKLVHDIEEEDWKDQVQIIGWMYQYYIAEKHNQVVNINKGTVKKEDIPAATQLFTTDWVVRYMVDNSLGRYWIERHPESNLADKLEFFVKPKNGDITYIDEDVTPEEMTFLDDCMGSGHILVYAFDVLMEIYRERGYSDREAARSIVENNLYGLDIDDRCTQLAYFAVMMKARSYDGRFLTRGIEPNVLAIQESNGIDTFMNEKITPDKEMNKIGQYLIHTFKDAKELGSLVSVEEKDYDGFLNYLDDCMNNAEYDIDVYQWRMDVLPEVCALAKQAKVLSKKYVSVTTNPPYLNKMEGKLKKFVTEHYKAYSGDLFSVFIYRNFDLCIAQGYMGYMTPFVWMFIKIYENLRKYILENKSIMSLIQMEYSAFEEATVPICSFVLKGTSTLDYGLYFKLSDFKGGMEVQEVKVREAIKNSDCGYFYSTSIEDFASIPGSPIAYWVSKKFREAFLYPSIKEVAHSCIGMRTGDNNRFLRFWFEVDNCKIGFGFESADEVEQSAAKWIPYHKGGDFRRWYGNNDYVVNWENNGKEIKDNTRKVYPQLGDNLNWKITNEKYYFCEGITWTAVSSAKTGFRRYKEGFIFSNAGQSIISNGSSDLDYLTGLLNSKVVLKILQMIAPTVRFESGEVGKIPVAFDSTKRDTVVEIVERLVDLSKYDWNSYEQSWDFIKHPLIGVATSNSNNFSNTNKVTLAECYLEWKQDCEERFLQLKSSEEELNSLFINIYGLNDELEPSVEDRDITIHRIYDNKKEIPESMQSSPYVRTKQDEVVSLLSYAVGCMFGRYSLSTEGLAYAGGEWDETKYPNFLPDEDNVIPITDHKYMDDDIVERLCEFLKIVYGEKSLETNLDFIANALGGKGATSREVIRNYFLNDFFKDHCKTYQKRPIYWLFDSGKQNGFKALVYMHRWDKNSIGRVLVYLHKIQEKYEIEVRAIDAMLEHMTDKRQQAVEEQRRDHLLKQIAEIKEYDESLDHMTNEHIDIDLDDGVKVNYEKVQTDRNGTQFKILAPIK